MMTKTLSINKLHANLKNFAGEGELQKKIVTVGPPSLQKTSFLIGLPFCPYPVATPVTARRQGNKTTSRVQITKKEKYHKLFYCGAHLGHKSLKMKSAWHSSISTFLLGSLNNSGILKSKYTLTCFLKAFYILTLIVKSGGHILIINNNPEFSKLLQHIKKNTYSNPRSNTKKSSKIFYSDCHWVGGTLTNWAQIYQSISTFTNFYHKFDDFLLKNNIHFPRYKKMKKSFKGFIFSSKKNSPTSGNLLDSATVELTGKFPAMQSTSNKVIGNQLNIDYEEKINFLFNDESSAQSTQNSFLEADWKPDLLFILDSNNTEGIIREASKLQIPIIALVDSNTNISNITYPIPTNNNSFIFAWFCLDWITRITNKYSSRREFLVVGDNK